MTTLKKETYVLKYRWKTISVEGVPNLLYYGVRNPPHHHDVRFEISQDLNSRIDNNQPLVPSEESDSLRVEILDLVHKKILVEPHDQLAATTPETMQTCTRCITNDYVVPGLEFNEDGVCALCQCYDLAPATTQSPFATISEEALLEAAAANTHSRFDAMVLYTGGKDSSHMLWLLARKLKLRVLAGFWNMPYCSEAAYANIRRARETMPEVEFVEWSLPQNTFRDGMRGKWRIHGWPCMCPSAAFPLLYPMATRLKIPYVFLGIEDVQTAVLEYVVAPPRRTSAKPSFRDQTLAFLSARALPNAQKPILRWPDEMANYHAAVRQAMPDIFQELAELVQNARNNPDMRIPLIARLSTNEKYGSWENASQIIEQEMGWQAPEDQNSLLHTSCILEPVKDYLQFQRFRNMETVFMPQSIVELGAAVFFGMTPREDAFTALEELGYWQQPPILERLLSDLEITQDTVEESDDKMRTSLAKWAGLSS